MENGTPLSLSIAAGILIAAAVMFALRAAVNCARSGDWMVAALYGLPVLFLASGIVAEGLGVHAWWMD